MPAFLVELGAASGLTLKDGINAFVVFANNDTDAKAIAKSLIDGDNDAHIANATVTQIVAGANLQGWTLRVAVLNANPVIDITVTGAAAATIDTIAALAVIALNATAINASAYDAGTNILTIAGVADNLGDKTVLVEFKPPVASFPGAVPIPGLVGAITHQGAAGAALTVALAADAFVIPNVLRGLRQT